ncbi:MAG: glycosyltransferase family 4 protein [Betaproteobacteria bacterium]|nr:glycosyltransferase family 4 protein [Betaproteobacteria bacterium]
MRIAYFVNQYPKVSHSFIRREILALEAAGNAVQRFALRGWDGELADEEDLREREKTRYILQYGLVGLLLPVLQQAVLHPLRLLAGVQLAWRMSKRADRSLPYHLVYLAEACRLLHWLQATASRHVHAHFGSNSAEVVMLAHAMGGPTYSFTVHGPEEFDKPQAIGLTEKIRRAAFVVAISSFGRSQLYRWVDHFQWPKIHVVHCGLEEGFYQVPAVALPDKPRLVCVGRLCEQKGQLLLLEAARRLALDGEEFELVLAGDGEMRAEIEHRITEYGLDNRVRITGWISSAQVRDEILRARGMVLPSFAEGLPVVIMEALALRRPVISTFVAGIPELVLPGENGWLVPAGDVEALAAAMRELLRAPVGQLSAMGELGRARALERHDIATEAATLAALFSRAGA